MVRFFGDSFTRRASLAALAAVATAGAAGAGTIHRLSISQTSGSGGAQTVLQNSASGSAFQGEVGGASSNSNIHIPFGLLGEYDPPSPAFGIGVIGISVTGYGIAGESLGANPSVLGLAGGSGDGVEGVVPASSSSSGIHGVAKGTGPAVFGESSNANGLAGGFMSGTTAPALQAASTSGDGADFFSDSGGAGMYGQVADPSYGAWGNNIGTATPGPTAGADYDAGVYGSSTMGNGVFGYNGNQSAAQSPTGQTNDAGVYGAAAAGPGVLGNSFTTHGGQGFLGLNTGEGVLGQGYSGNTTPAISAYDSIGGSDLLGAFACTAVTNGICSNNAESFIVQTTSANRSNALTTFYPAAADVQVSGDLYVFGKIYAQCGAFPAGKTTNCYDATEGTAYGTQQGVARSAGGRDVAVYHAVQSVKTIEDLGQAQLVNGRAYVALDPAFARTTQPGAPYMVFVTPEGDSRGVFTTNHTLNGFEVRENAGGRSTMTFDYRIVAKPLGDDSKRFAEVAPRTRIAAYNPRVLPRHATRLPHVAKRPQLRVHASHEAPLQPILR